MQEKNILNKYKESLGQYCAINQFVELATRCFVSDHKDEIKNRDDFIALATRNSITITDYDYEKIVNLISKSYIVNINVCFEAFLNELYVLIKTYGKTEYIEKKKEDSWLMCIVYNIFSNGLPEETKSLLDLCEYYRLVRNYTAHNGDNIDNLLKQYKKLSKYNFKTDTKFVKLSAPNTFNEICFDDFVMFARSSMELATLLFDSITYDYKKLLSTVPTSVQNKWKLYTPKRREQAIRTYIKVNFKTDKFLEEQLSYLVEMFSAQ